MCGITCPGDAQYAVSLGVDAIGMILHADSPRTISIDTAQAIRAVVPPMVSLIGVVVNAPQERAKQLYQEIQLDYLQLHGEESAEYANTLGLPYIRAIRARNAEQVAKEMQQHTAAGAFLLDPYVAGQHGGTGKTLDKSLWPLERSKPLILAGGLGPDNMTQRLQEIHPYAVDLNSGVESAPGIKSRSKLDAALTQIYVPSE